MHPRPRVPALLLALFAILGGTARPASAQQTMTDVLGFLLTNRSIPTGDFVRDEQAAAQTRDVFARLLTLQLATLPVASTYQRSFRSGVPASRAAIQSATSVGR